MDKTYYAWASTTTNTITWINHANLLSNKPDIPYVFINDIFGLNLQNQCWSLHVLTTRQIPVAPIKCASCIHLGLWFQTFGVCDQVQKPTCVENLLGARWNIKWCALVEPKSAMCACPCILFTQNSIVISVINSHYKCTHDRTPHNNNNDI